MIFYSLLDKEKRLIPKTITASICGDKVAWSFIIISFCILFYFVERKNGSTSIAGVTVGVDVTRSQKVFNSLQALGNIALAYFFSNVLIEIQASQYSLNIQSFYVWKILGFIILWKEK